MREQARALTGFRNDWDDDKGPVNFRYDREAPRHRHEADLREARALRLAGLLPARRPPPEAPLVLRHQALELLHSDRRRPQLAGTGAALRRQPLAIRPGRRGDPHASAPLQRAAHGQAARRLPRRDAACDGSAASTPKRGRGSRTRPANSSSTRRTSPAGTTPLARHRLVPRPLEPRRPRPPALGPRDVGTRGRSIAEKLARSVRSSSGATPPMTSTTKRALKSFATTRSPTPISAGRRRSTRPDRERASPSDRRLPRPADVS